jgi:DNA repair protein RecO (recombination protein O)
VNSKRFAALYSGVIRNLSFVITNMTHKTKGIVLRTIKYGETSLVVNIYTELFGLQAYMVNGVRSAKKGAAKANLFQVGAMLDLLVYHSDTKPMQRLKEFTWLHLYNNVLSDVIKNSIALYMMELLQKCLKQPEPNTDLYHFCEEALLQLDQSGKTATANFTLFFTLQLPYFFGFRITDNYDETHTVLDLAEGVFAEQPPNHLHFIEGEPAALTSQLLRVMQPYELDQFKLNQQTRRSLLLRYLDYYALHIQEFGQVKTIVVLHEVL